MSDHYGVYLNFKKKIDDILFSLIDRKYPATLYEPIRYLLSSGGKRIRPMMVMFACEATGEDPEKSVNAAVAMELLHNFTLVHDDIMDNANTRRGFQTIHKKWNENVAILTGDLLIGLAYKYLFKTETLRLKETADEFTGGIIEVCEGQSFDKEFEERDNVTLDEYMMMINKKTAKMLEISAAIGALTGNADKDLLNNLKKFAMNTGLAFQIQDDLLDITADESELGKKIGGDILERKKTFLLIKATETVSGADRNLIMDIINRPDLNISDEIILQVKDIYIKQGITEAARSEIEIFTNKADDYLSNIKNNSSVDRLKWFSAMLMERKF
ncbi:MAG TPA: polyprenyl synthetase family protein [Ignavibacteria bacterium]|nr:polyprenyl synthetase family protein [Bacteroidota bacterium]HRI85410.1 polyprenyl synthetase family protein [Ignavibacteria bacterium]HRK00250.1 polyprenyl synthetase family protein [Ignavibacteria bacterium]